MTTEVADGLAAAAGDLRTWMGLSWSREVTLLRLTAVVWWTCGALAAAAVAPRVVARADAALDAGRLRVLAVGLLFHASMILGLILGVRHWSSMPWMAATVVLGACVVAVRAAGLAAAFVWIGERLLARRGGGSAYAQLAVGALASGALALVPVVGPVAWLLLASLGTGAVLATWRR